MIESLNCQHLYDSDKLITTLHDELVILQNQKKVESISDEIRTFDNTQKLTDLFPEYTLLNSERKLFLEGQKMNHCIHSRWNDSGENHFFSIKHSGEDWSLQVKNGKAYEIRGKFNKTPPQTLINEINSKIPNYYEKISI